MAGQPPVKQRGMWRVRVLDGNGKILSTSVVREEPIEAHVVVDRLGLFHDTLEEPLDDRD